MKTWSALLLLAALIGVAPLAAAADDAVVARVNGVDIKQSDLDFAASEVGPRLANYTPADRKRVLLQYVIENELMAEAGEKDKLDKTPRISLTASNTMSAARCAMRSSTRASPMACRTTPPRRSSTRRSAA